MSKHSASSKSTLCRIKITAAYIYSLIAVMERDSTELKESHRFLMQENIDGQPEAILYETCFYDDRDGAYDYFERSAL